jgi:hypothetical protein
MCIPFRHRLHECAGKTWKKDEQAIDKEKGEEEGGKGKGKIVPVLNMYLSGWLRYAK